MSGHDTTPRFWLALILILGGYSSIFPLGIAFAASPYGWAAGIVAFALVIAGIAVAVSEPSGPLPEPESPQEQVGA